MSYQVLARKWRPRNFKEMVGQEHVLRAMVNALDQGRLHHAYLFTGTRGVGKTTIARILAKSLNCEEGMGSEPCGVCNACREIDEGRFIDLIEVDAASRTKVEDTRELLDNVQYAPTRGRYKVYLIDEVHMLSTHSFNALLKTLEEPPPHVKFLLATTDPQKLPATILSRCLQFNLKRMPVELIESHLQHILQEESINNEPLALKHLALAADGSMRDALSLLDQAIAYGHGAVNTQDVVGMLGYISLDSIYDILTALANNDAQALLAAVAHLAEMSPDFESILNELVSQLYQLTLAHMAPDAIDDSLLEHEKIISMSQCFTLEDIQLYYQIGLLGKRDFSLAPSPREGLEMILLRMLVFRPVGDASVNNIPTPVPVAKSVSPPQTTNKVAPTVSKQAQPVAKAIPVESMSEPNVKSVTEQITKPIEQSVTPSADVVSPVSTDEMSWAQIIQALNLKGMVSQLAANCEIKQREQNQWILTLSSEHEQLYSLNFEERLQQALSDFLAQPIKLKIEVGEPVNETPAGTIKREQDERQQAAIDEIEQDQMVQAFKDKFGAEVQVEGIKPYDA